MGNSQSSQQRKQVEQLRALHKKHLDAQQKLQKKHTGQAFDTRRKYPDAKVQMKQLHRLQKKHVDQAYKLKKKQLVEAQKLVGTLASPPRKGKKKYYDAHADLYGTAAELFGDQIKSHFSGADGGGGGFWGGDGGGGGVSGGDGGGGGGGGGGAV